MLFPLCLLPRCYHAGAQAEEQIADRLAMDAEEERQRAEDAVKRAALQKRALEQKLEIQTQMVAKAHNGAAEEDEKLRALEIAATAEKAYMGQVRDALQKTDPPKWFGRKKFDFYN